MFYIVTPGQCRTLAMLLEGFLYLTKVYAAFGRWTLVLTLSFVPFGRSGREIHDV